MIKAQVRLQKRQVYNSEVKIKSILIIIVIVVVAIVADNRFDFFNRNSGTGEVVVEGENNGTTTYQVTGEVAEVEYVVEEVVRGLSVPWSIVFTSPERMLVTERSGKIRVVQDGKLQNTPVHTFPEVSVGGEEGLMSLALHPNYNQNKFIYASLAYETGSTMYVKVVRFRDDGTALVDAKIIIDKIPGSQFHAGSRIAFGPDNKLYITTGDATDRTLAQKLDSRAGKILRLNDDGTIPSDNPFPNSPIWSYGHRNPQGLAWHPITNELYSTEHGPSVFDGPTGGDEVNRIVKGGNYGWPLVSHDKTREGTIAPLVTFTPSEAPGSALFYSGTAIPQFKNNFFFGALKGEGLMRIVFDGENKDEVVRSEKLPEVSFGRIREVIEGLDGYIYFSTSNKDGRGKVKEGDDKIYRIRPR